MRTTTEILNALREAGFSQMEISRRTGIPQPRVSRWQKGSIPVGANDALKLMDMLIRSDNPENANP